MTKGLFLTFFGGLVLLAGCRGAERGPQYLAEEILDTSTGPDEALVDVRIAASRWPDCTTLRSATEDIFRIEGVGDKPDQEKALAVWKWFRIMVCSTGGGVASVPTGFYAREGHKGKEKVVFDPHKIMTVYGIHMCDGLSWALAGLWRGGGYVAFDECTWGHTTAAFRYRDADGKMRFHTFDPNGRYYYWDAQRKILSTRSMPVMRGMVYRHLTAPQRMHSLRTSLRVGETVVRKWDNSGHIVPQGKDKLKTEAGTYFAHAPGRTDGLYAIVGEEVQILKASTAPHIFAGQLAAGSVGTACSAPEEGKATLHPEKAGAEAEFIYRLAPPYVVADAEVEATLLKGEAGDTCRLFFSTDGKSWTPIFTKEKTGEEKVTVNIGKEAWKASRANVYTCYNFLLKAKFKTAGEVRKVGMNALKVTTWRQLNKRTLPNLRPGENWLRVTAEELRAGLALELELSCRLKGKDHKIIRRITRFPHYFKIDVPGVAETVHKNLRDYDKHFNDGDIQMSHFKMRLVPAAEITPSLPGAAGRAAFAASCPHPADMTDKKTRKRVEAHAGETSGFFPQSGKRLDDDAVMNALIKKFRTARRRPLWLAAEELGNYPKAVDALLERLPGADIDLTLFICKALAQIGDRKAVKPLLEKWKQGPAGAPGTRYIPDALAAIGDRSVVPELIKPLKKVRFDFRFHIIHALGVLGGPEAERALRDLSRNDPLRANREFAAEQNKEWLTRKRGGG